MAKVKTRGDTVGVRLNPEKQMWVEQQAIKHGISKAAVLRVCVAVAGRHPSDTESFLALAAL